MLSAHEITVLCVILPRVYETEHAHRDKRHSKVDTETGLEFKRRNEGETLVTEQQRDGQMSALLEPLSSPSN